MTMHSYSLHSSLRLDMELREARFGLEPEDLFSLAVRQNEKRPFLFVSRVLGKHLPIRPSALLAAGKLLSLAYLGEEDDGGWAGLLRGEERPFEETWQTLERSRHTITREDRTLFIGFAETATGLGRAVADCFAGELAYIDTTRLELPGRTPLTFDEAHSHARTHLLYLDHDDPFMAGCKQAVLVDDELTTGSTALRLIRQLHAAFGIRRFTLMALLDNSDGENRAALERELGVEIRAVSLLRGRIADVTAGEAPQGGLTDLRELSCAALDWRDLRGEPLSGRFLLSTEDLSRQRERCRALARELGPVSPETLCLGTGEFIYAPAIIAGFCGAERFHSTTQSPVYPVPGSAITSGVRFNAPDGYSSVGYLYNLPEQPGGNVRIFAEAKALRREGLCRLAAFFKNRGAGKVTVFAL